MFNMFKKAFWVPYENSDVYPTVTNAQQLTVSLPRNR